MRKVRHREVKYFHKITLPIRNRTKMSGSISAWQVIGIQYLRAEHMKGFGQDSSQVAPVVKSPLANAGDVRDMGSIPGWEDSLEKELATCSSILGWEIPWTEEPGTLQPIGSQRVGHD